MRISRNCRPLFRYNQSIGRRPSRDCNEVRRIVKTNFGDEPSALAIQLRANARFRFISSMTLTLAHSRESTRENDVDTKAMILQAARLMINSMTKGTILHPQQLLTEYEHHDGLRPHTLTQICYTFYAIIVA